MGSGAQRPRADRRPIGVFDSGVGGLTVMHELLVTIPHEDVVYLGDNARLPYGPRPLDEIRGFALQIGRHLERIGVKLVVAACNSATAAALPELQRELSVPVVGVLQPEAHAAALATRNRRVGLLATEATVTSGRYEALIATARRWPRCARPPPRCGRRASTPSSSGAPTIRSSGPSSSACSAGT
jgi:glutamate racemase